MTWMIGRTEAIADPEAARRKALDKLRGLAELDDPEGVVVPILIDALLLVESYRGAPPDHLPPRAHRQHRRLAARARHHGKDQGVVRQVNTAERDKFFSGLLEGGTGEP